MNINAFSFGIIVVPRTAADWTAAVQRAERQGFSSVLLPDTTFTTSPMPALAAAAAVTSTIKLRPWVLAAPLRHPGATTREVAALQLLSDGRFELGIGAGRPGGELDAAKLGMAWGTPGERRRQVAETVAAVREAVDPMPPVIVAASGPRLLADAVGYADRISLAAQPQATVADLAPLVDNIRSAANADLPIGFQIVGVGDRLPQFTASKFGLSAAELRAAGAAGVISGDPAEAVAELTELRDRFGIDEFLVPGELADAFVPVLAQLHANA
ncbi:LLM class flavin-dependent oxidoreductase [Antrihabitans stalactiti]|uniref:LLM class flavin-dependent oxidoreductase n=1 Tax=Antrihabitans stalactiti TaxID=2584121 RepID=A0A848KGN6_9NOCA|nr:LLM class flavin-dependent oxidoreductase [Antrihabitans stalactiti]NMN96936.1 LLM class flavin-dependent oxidoreductase [Antrihabitans stalactiti]